MLKFGEFVKGYVEFGFGRILLSIGKNMENYIDDKCDGDKSEALP